MREAIFNYLTLNTLRVKKSIFLGNNVVIGRCARIEVYDVSDYENNELKIIIGNNVNINWYCHIGAINKIEIRDNCLIGSNVLIIDHAHGDTCDLNNNPLTRKLISKGPIIIEENCWIGENVVILPNVKIGHNSVIGANSVVTKDVKPFSVCVGSPAKIINRNDQNDCM